LWVYISNYGQSPLGVDRFFVLGASGAYRTTISEGPESNLCTRCCTRVLRMTSVERVPSFSG
jgi:hypothetical protein